MWNRTLQRIFLYRTHSLRCIPLINIAYITHIHILFVPRRLFRIKMGLRKLWFQFSDKLSLTTVFVDTRLWKTKHPPKRFQNFRQSCVSLTDWIEIHQLQPLVWPSNHLYFMLSGCDWWISMRSVKITRKTDGKFGNVSGGVLFSKVAYQRKRW